MQSVISTKFSPLLEKTNAADFGRIVAPIPASTRERRMIASGDSHSIFGVKPCLLNSLKISSYATDFRNL